MLWIYQHLEVESKLKIRKKKKKSTDWFSVSLWPLNSFYILYLSCIFSSRPHHAPSFLLHRISWLLLSHHAPQSTVEDCQRGMRWTSTFPPLNPSFILVPPCTTFSSFLLSTEELTLEDPLMKTVQGDSSRTVDVGLSMCHVLTKKCSPRIGDGADLTSAYFSPAAFNEQGCFNKCSAIPVQMRLLYVRMERCLIVLFSPKP